LNFIKIGRPMAGGSQIIINKNGITFITPAKFEALNQVKKLHFQQWHYHNRSVLNA